MRKPLLYYKQWKGAFMIQIFKTVEGSLQILNEITEGCWIAMTNPSAAELLDVSEKTNIELNHLRAPLDEEERARIEVEENYTVIVVDIPTIEKGHGKVCNNSSWYYRSRESAYNCLFGRNTDSKGFYGRKNKGFLYF